MWKILKKAGNVWFATAVAAPICAFAFFRYALPFELPERPYSSTILDRHGIEIGETLSTEKTRHRPLPTESVPPFMRTAAVTLEDRRFFSHPGIDPVGIFRAAWRNAVAGKVTEGASTIEMGLARATLGITNERTYARKIKEMAIALRIAGKYEKDETLARYLNRIEFGRLSIGVAAAARSYFGKELGNLTEAEQVSLLVMAKNPAGLDPVRNPAAFRKRFETAVATLESEGIFDSRRSELALAEKLSYPAPKDALPYVADAVEEGKFWPIPTEAAGIVTTTLDWAMTRKIEKIANGALSELLWRNVGDYSVLLVDRRTMEIRVLIGGTDYGSNAWGQVNALFAPRQVGSTLKPFVYLLAMERFDVKAGDTVLDLPVSFQTADGMPYEPKNYSLSYRGPVTVAEALAGSLNVPAIRMAEKVGVGELLAYLRSLRISTLIRDADHYGLSLALGAGEIPLFELLRAYTVFAREGQFCEFEAFPWKNDDCRSMAESAKTAEIVRILTNRSFKLREFGSDTALDFPDRPVFVKTGTSRNFRDNYAVGFAGDYLLAVWSGNKDGTNMKGVSGATGAGEIFGRIIREFVPEGGAPREERLTAEKAGYLEILSPLPESRYRFDPGIPTERQKFLPDFSTDLSHVSARWTLDGNPLPGDVEIGKLQAGRHVLRVDLETSDGKTVSAESAFSVE